MKEKYISRYSEFWKTQHKRAKTQLQKIGKIIKDAEDLNQILDNPDRPVKKNGGLKRKDPSRLDQKSHFYSPCPQINI